MAISVFDCGGRGGVHRSWNSFDLPLDYFSFEPDESAIQEVIDSNSSSYINQKVINTAVLDSKGESNFNIYNEADLSSFLELNTCVTSRYKYVKKEKIIKMKHNTIDNICDEANINLNFLSIDTQGTSYEILKGAKKQLTNIWGIRVELELIELYKNQKLHYKTLEFLDDNNFMMVKMEACGSPNSFMSTDMNNFSINPIDSTPTFYDAIFMKKSFLNIQELKFSLDNIEEYLYSIFFSIHNGSGYMAMQLIQEMKKKNFLNLFLSELTKTVKEKLLSLIALYLAYERTNINKNRSYDDIFKDLFNGSIDSYKLLNNINTKKKLDSLYKG